MARQRIPEWESRRALAIYLYDHSPITAEFVGQMSAKIARILDKTTDKLGPWSGPNANQVLRSLVETGHVQTEGTSVKITRVTWIGQTDPNLIDWEPAKPAPPAGSLEARVAALEAEVARIPTLVRQAVDIAMEAWIQ